MAGTQIRIMGGLASVAVLAAALAACASPSGSFVSSTPAMPSVGPAEPTPVASAATQGGEPRTGGYWEMWSTCGDNSQAAMASANGGRSAGWILADDLLTDPGIEVGPVHVVDCAQGLNLLRFKGADGSDRSKDPVVQLAGQLYTAELNLAAGARSCTELEGTIIAAQTLLTNVGFDRSVTWTWSMADAATAADLARRLAEYNGGGLCP